MYLCVYVCVYIYIYMMLPGDLYHDPDLSQHRKPPNLRMRMYVCIYVCVHMYVPHLCGVPRLTRYTYIYAYTSYTCIYISCGIETWIYTYANVHTHVDMHLRHLPISKRDLDVFRLIAYIPAHTHTYINTTHIRTYIHTYIHSHTHKQTHTYIPRTPPFAHT